MIKISKNEIKFIEGLTSLPITILSGEMSVILCLIITDKRTRTITVFLIEVNKQKDFLNLYSIL